MHIALVFDLAGTQSTPSEPRGARSSGLVASGGITAYAYGDRSFVHWDCRRCRARAELRHVAPLAHRALAPAIARSQCRAVRIHLLRLCPIGVVGDHPDSACIPIVDTPLGVSTMGGVALFYFTNIQVSVIL